MISLLYTIGTALNRAMDSGAAVTVLVSGHWIEGRVAAVDGHGVVLAGDDEDHHVVRTEDIAAVRVRMPVPADRAQGGGYAEPAPATATELAAG